MDICIYLHVCVYVSAQFMNVPVGSTAAGSLAAAAGFSATTASTCIYI